MNNLDKTIECLNLSKRVYNAIVRHMHNIYKENNKITIRDLISLDYEQIRRIRNLGKKGISELLVEVHLLGLEFDFEKDDKYMEDLDFSSLESCLSHYQRYLIKIQEQQEKIEKMKEELEQLNRNKAMIEVQIEKLSGSNPVKTLKNE